MLLEPFEEQFDLPAAPIQVGDGQSWYGEVVGQEDQGFAAHRIAIADPAQRVRIIQLGSDAGHHDGLVKTQAGGFVHRPGVAAGVTEVLLGAGDEKSPALMQPMPPGEVEVAAIHDIERAGFPDQLVEDVHVMHTACGDNDDGGKFALEGQQGVKFDGGFGAAEGGPRKQREAEINGGGIQSVTGGLEFVAERFLGIERSGLLDENVAKSAKMRQSRFSLASASVLRAVGWRMPA